MNDTDYVKQDKFCKLFNKLALYVVYPVVFHPIVPDILMLLLNCINFKFIIKFQLHKLWKVDLKYSM
jgi:hypothetical protein